MITENPTQVHRSGDVTCQPLYFLHIPKTAGTSLRHWLLDMFDADDWLPCYNIDDLRALPPSEIKSYRFFSGHFSLGLYDYLDQPPATITWLREPLARIVSQHEYQKRRLEDMQKGQFDGKAPTADQMAEFEHLKRYQDRTLVEHCQAPGYQGRGDNLQVRFLTGNTRWAEATPCNEQMLEAAKDRLTGMFHFGISEWMDPSLDLLSWHLARPRRTLRHRFNTRDQSPRANSLSESDLAVVAEANRYDLQLYEFAQNELRRRLTQWWKEKLGWSDISEDEFQSIVSSYHTPSRQSQIEAVLRARFHETYRVGHVTPSDVTVDFAQRVVEKGWYPRSKDQDGHFIRWAGPEHQSSIFVPLVEGTSYRIMFQIKHFVDKQMIKKLRLRVGRSYVRLMSKKVETPEGQACFRVSGLIPARLVQAGGRFTELVFETPGTRQQHVDYDLERYVSFATDKFEFEPAEKSTWRLW